MSGRFWSVSVDLGSKRAVKRLSLYLRVCLRVCVSVVSAVSAAVCVCRIQLRSFSLSYRSQSQLCLLDRPWWCRHTNLLYLEVGLLTLCQNAKQ